MNTRNPHIGSDLDDFLEEQDLKEEVSTIALKRVNAWQIGEASDLGGAQKTQPSTPSE